MKRIGYVLLTALLAINTTVFAAEAKLMGDNSNVTYEYKTYFKADFEDEDGAQGTAPASLCNSIDGGACAAQAATLRDALPTDDKVLLGNRYILGGQIGNQIDLRFMAGFGEPVSTGKLYVEFDISPTTHMTSAGYFTLGFMDSDLYYGKSSWFMTVKSTGQITANGAVGATPVTSLANGQNIFITPGEWHHVVAEADFDRSTVSFTINGIKSNAISMNFMPNGKARYALSSYQSWGPTYFDNIHIYRAIALNKKDGKAMYFDEDFENDIFGQSPGKVSGEHGAGVTDEAVVTEGNDGKALELRSVVRAIMDPFAQSDRVVLEFDAKISSSQLGVGFINSKSMDSINELFTLDSLNIKRKNTALSNESGERLEYTQGEWYHYVCVMDLNESSAQIYIDEDRSVWVTDISGLGNSDLAGIGFTNNGEPALIDNIEIYKHPVYVKRVVIIDSGNSIVTEYSEVPTVIDSIVLELSIPVDDIDHGCITLSNENSGENVDIKSDLSDNKRFIYIKPTAGYLPEYSNYILDVSGQMTGSAPQNISNDYVFDFVSSAGVMTVYQLAVTDLSGNVVSSVRPGDSVILAVDYAKSGEESILECILAHTATQNGELKDISVETITLDKFGRNIYQKEVNIPSNIQFDKVNVLLWDSKTKMPVVPRISVGGTR